jgi:hypothetical protein
MSVIPDAVNVRAECASGGGPVPCWDDLCHGSDTTLCRLERGYDFCDHGNIPDWCSFCRYDEDDDWEDLAPVAQRMNASASPVDPNPGEMK